MRIPTTGPPSSSSATTTETAAGTEITLVSIAHTGEKPMPLRNTDRVWGRALLVFVTGLLAFAGAGRGDEPPKTEAKPPWQRLLQGSDARQDATFQARIE